MNEAGIKWFGELTAYTNLCRKNKPLPLRDNLPLEEEMQCRIIGGSLIGWLQSHGPRLLKERAVLSHLKNWEKEPYIIFTSNQAGLVAANEILQDKPPPIIFLFHDEFMSWNKEHPDTEYSWHVHTWSYFTTMDTDLKKKAEKYPLHDSETYWLHREGTICGPLFGRGGDHLWKWNGQEPDLLEEGFNLWVS